MTINRFRFEIWFDGHERCNRIICNKVRSIVFCISDHRTPYLLIHLNHQKSYKNKRGTALVMKTTWRSSDQSGHDHMYCVWPQKHVLSSRRLLITFSKWRWSVRYIIQSRTSASRRLSRSEKNRTILYYLPLRHRHLILCFRFSMCSCRLAWYII